MKLAHEYTYDITIMEFIKQNNVTNYKLIICRAQWLSQQNHPLAVFLAGSLWPPHSAPQWDICASAGTGVPAVICLPSVGLAFLNRSLQNIFLWKIFPCSCGLTMISGDHKCDQVYLESDLSGMCIPSTNFYYLTSIIFIWNPEIMKF